MCTATWWRNSGEYGLLFNRDEQRSRAPGEPPREWCRDGVRFIAPRDPQGGGTWIAGNQRGLLIALLNHFPAQTEAGGGERSRGLLLFDLATCTDVQGVEAALARARLHCYRPCFVFAMDGMREQHWIWDGAQLHSQAPEPPLTTSSYASDAVTTARRADFRERFGPAGMAGADALRRYHLHHDPQQAAHSVLMAREDAATRSFSELVVSRERLSFYYHRVISRTVPVLTEPVDCHLSLCS